MHFGQISMMIISWLEREATLWDMEEKNLLDKHQLLKQQMKDQYFLQRHLLLKKHEKVSGLDVFPPTIPCTVNQPN